MSSIYSNIKIIAVDLDGTLLDSHKCISKRTFDAMKAAADMGIHIVPSTGRFFKLIPEEVRSLPFVDYAICSNGADIHDAINDVSLDGDKMDPSEVIKIMEYLDTLDVIYDVYIDGWGYMQKDHFSLIYDERYIVSPYYIINMERGRTQVDDIKHTVANFGKKVEKIQFYSQNSSVIMEGFDYIPKSFKNIIAATSQRDDCEINATNANKGFALTKLAEILNVDMKNVMAFGDGGNDVSMLKAAGVGVAMGNARKMVMDAADYVTLSNDEDGIADAIEKLILQK